EEPVGTVSCKTSVIPLRATQPFYCASSSRDSMSVLTKYGQVPPTAPRTCTLSPADVTKSLNVRGRRIQPSEGPKALRPSNPSKLFTFLKIRAPQLQIKFIIGTEGKVIDVG